MQKFDPIIRLIPKMPRWLWFLVYGIIIINLSQLLADGFLFFAMVGLGVTFRGVRKRQSYLQNQDMAKRIQQTQRYGSSSRPSEAPAQRLHPKQGHRKLSVDRQTPLGQTPKHQIRVLSTQRTSA
ncbi:hypothetical protein ABG811_00905 [Streptococcus iniae]